MNPMADDQYVANTSLKLILLVALLAIFSTISVAELPPYVYQERQEKAPESLSVRVQSVKTRETDEPRRKLIDVRIVAQVEQVHRSQTGLKRGDVIHIKYLHSQYKEPLAGPSEVPILQEEQIYPAYLLKNEQEETFTPAAGGYSFREVK